MTKGDLLLLGVHRSFTKVSATPFGYMLCLLTKVGRQVGRVRIGMRILVKIGCYSWYRLSDKLMRLLVRLILIEGVIYQICLIGLIGNSIFWNKRSRESVDDSLLIIDLWHTHRIM